MESATMGRVTTEATIENVVDLWNAKQGSIPDDQVRRATVTDALVDTGSFYLCLPGHLIRRLGLMKQGRRHVTTTLGDGEADIYGTVRLTIMGRDCAMDVMELPDKLPVLIGQLPLEALDFVVDPKGQKLIGNPAHGGEFIIEMY